MMRSSVQAIRESDEETRSGRDRQDGVGNHEARRDRVFVPHSCALETMIDRRGGCWTVGVVRLHVPRGWVV